MKTAWFSFLRFGVCVLLLSAPTVSAVSLSVSPNLQQVFRGSSSVYLSCVDDGQTADGWTVKRTRGGLTEDCGAAGSEFSRINSSFCVLDLSLFTGGNFLCVSSSGHQSEELSISVSGKDVILEIPALPVMTGSDVTLCCRPKEGERRKSHFVRDNVTLGSGPEGKWILSNVQRSDEGLYWCYTDIHPPSPQSRLRVRVDSPSPRSSAPPITPLPPPPSMSVLRLVLHLVVFCPYVACTALLLSIFATSSGNTPVISMETSHPAVQDDVTTEHHF
uniref:Ig-like domain-containing protein n=1 Tax=Astatotilapia calliptera TaxID=8154 RepID=A0AAX7V9G5_ASTCA